MRVLIIFSCIALALAKPQGYIYNQPQQGAVLVAESNQVTSDVIPGSSTETAVAAVDAAPASRADFQLVVTSDSAGSSSVGFGTSTSNFAASAKSTPAPIISKHYYIHSAPEEADDEFEDEEEAPRAARKHYRVVFIKAPSANLKAAARTLIKSQDEEKTAIYVLTKKADVSALKQAVEETPREPSKPEVFFIKYKTAEEAAHAQQQIQAQYDALGGATEFSDEGVAPLTSVIGALERQGGTVTTAVLASKTDASGDSSADVTGDAGAFNLVSRVDVDETATPANTYLPSAQ